MWLLPKRGQVLMGIQDVGGLMLIGLGFSIAGLSRMRPGYVLTDVDAFLEEVAQATW